ncbi:SIMPL domain-containing protein [Chloroflexota bacterium]
MKRKLLLSIALISTLLAIIIGTTGCDTLSPPTRTSPAGSSSLISQQNTGIWVTGEGKVTVMSDLAILSLGVEAQATTVAEAQNQTATAMDTVMQQLDSYGIASEDIKTQHFSIYPVRKWMPDEQEEILTGYRVNNMVTAKVRNVEDAGVIIDAVVKAGGDNIRINNINFTVDDPTAYHKEAREKAMADAESKARQLADSSGGKLGDPTYINESSGFITSPRISYQAEASIPAPTTPINPGETEIQINVQVVYSIK